MAEEAKKGSFKALIQDNPPTVPQPGDLLKGKVIALGKGEVRIDVAGLTTGVVRGRELFSESTQYNDIKVGDEVEATVLEEENDDGEMELSFRVAGFQSAWNSMKRLIKEGLAIKAKVLAANKGGLMMKVDALTGFMPVSQLSPDHYPRVAGGDKGRIFDKLQELISKELEVKVLDADEKEEKLIVSERAVWEDAQKAVLESYKVGDMVEGEVSALTAFGAFMKFGQGLEGLIHISEIAWQRIGHPKDVLKVGEMVKAQIIQLDRSKIYLSLKRLVDDPWKKAKEKYKLGDVVKGKVVKIEAFGLMIALDDEIHGLAHVSEISDEPMANINDKFKIGQTLDFEVMSLEPAEHRLGLRLAGVKGKSGRATAKSEEKKKDEDKEDKEESAQGTEDKPAETETK